MAEVMFGVQSSENTDTSPVPSRQLADKEDEDWYPRKIQPLPRSLVITLCILGLWRPRRDATRKRRASSQEWPSCPQPLCPQEAAHFQAGRTRTNSTTELIGYPPSATNNNCQDVAVPLERSQIGSSGHDRDPSRQHVRQVNEVMPFYRYRHPHSPQMSQRWLRQ